MPELESALLQPEARVLSTLESDGSRRWLTPRLSKGRFWVRRRITAYVLIALYALIPFIYINGKPAILLDVMHRQFTLFGYTFLPTDTILLAILMVAIILAIFAVTAVLGRVWCGWACPQTVYMEYVFRPIERLFYGRSGQGGKSSKPVAGWRKLAFFFASLLVCLHLSNMFLAYFVGVEQVHRWVWGSPLNHPAGFTIVMVVTLLMMFDFLYFREQTCIIACPYGRFQSVLLDRQSLIISYDEARGEPRGKRRMNESISLSSLILQPSSLRSKGDCVACELCVQVCPTGIDIRQGLQLECIGCAQCIDACDAVMDKLKMARGLIRYSTQSIMSGEKMRVIRPRVVIYSALLAALVTLLTILIVSKSATDVTLLRNLGRPFVITPAGAVENTMRVKIVNRSEKPQTYRVAAGASDVQIMQTNDSLSLKPGEMLTEPVQIIAPASSFNMGKRDIVIRVLVDGGEAIERTCRLLGPLTTIPTTGGSHD